MGNLIETGVYAVLGTFGVALLFGLVVFMSDYLDGWLRRRALGDIPFVDEGSNMSACLRWWSRRFEAEKEYAKAYELYSKRGKPYATRVKNNDHGIVLPLNSTKEWRSLPNDQLSFLHALSEFADLYMHTNVTDRTPLHAVHYCNNTNTLSRFNRHIVDATCRTLPLIAGTPTDHEWKQVNVFYSILSLCSTVAMSVVLGPEFTMDTSLIQTIMMYNRAIMPSCAERTSYPRILRPFVWRLSPLCLAMQSNLSKAKMNLIPEIKHRIGIARSKKGLIENGGPMSLLDGLIEMAFEKGSLSRSSDRGDDRQQANLLAEEIMFYHFELSSPIAFFITFNLYVIMNHKEYLAPLREEISEASKRSGGSLTLDTLKHAPRLESFVKETCRLYDISCLTSFRRVMKPVHLESINLSLNAGTIIMSPGRDVHLDPEYYENPTTFDGYRFYDASRGTCTPHISTTSPTFLTFSHGISACPARVLATQITRVIFILFLLKYDVELAHEEMPSYGIADGPVYLPNPSVMMRVRTRQKGALGL
ncbi:cytochrome P450 [Aspergillus caelatus]|uniref:Cytochrome P450 n=1 Tax=Aspergillus caelatus TaxID=61420 RepID=A0A5N7A0T6_9EURO|nr:cytochrome P450 [Aspergillus caelatus]KAE8363467.1 cytochrome P450 [Aspergillus caelatus]